MTNKTSNLNFSELDYEEIRSSIVDYLRTKTEFEDFDFQGSAISLLIDALAYTQTYMAVHANMAVGETFLQSARLRSNVVARAKELGYIPHSYRASEAKFKMTYEGPTVDGMQPIAPRGTIFKSSSRNFVLIEDYIFNRVGDQKFESEMSAYEGTMITHKFNYYSGEPPRKWRIPDENVDLHSMRVTTGQGESTLVWRNGNKNIDLAPGSLVYFVQEDGEGYFELYFGDGILGRKPDEAEEVTLEYLKTSGKEANGQLITSPASKSSFLNITDGNYANLLVDHSSIQRSSGGNNKELTESIRKNAPLFYQTQNRAVTRNDYLYLVKNEYSFIEAVNVWGGQDNVPPFYGVVFIAVKPTSGVNLSAPIRQQIEDTIREKYSVLTITPRVVDTEFVNVHIDTVVSYSPERTNKTSGQLVELIRDQVDAYFNEELMGFDVTMRYSRLVSAIDDSDSSILGNVSIINLSRIFSPVINKVVEYRMNYFNELMPGSIRSREYIVNNIVSQFKDNGQGTISLYENGKIRKARVGTVDYKNGIVVLSKHVFGSSSPSLIEFFANPIPKQDVVSIRNGIIQYAKGNHSIQLKASTQRSRERE